MKTALICTLLILTPICGALIAISGDWRGVLAAGALWFVPLLLISRLVLLVLDKSIGFIASLRP